MNKINPQFRTIKDFIRPSREQLEVEALENVCSCFDDQLKDDLPDLNDRELQDIIDDSYAMHYAYGDSLDDCRDYRHNKAESDSENAMEMERGN